MSEMLKNFSKMMNNQEMPENIKSFMNNMNNTNISNINENKKGSSENFNSSKNSNNSNNFNNPNNSESSENNNSFRNDFNSNDVNNIFGNIDMNTIFKIQQIMNSMKNSENDSRTNLLLSLKPYLKESRKNKIDQYIQLMKMEKIFEIMNPIGGESKHV